MERKLLIIAVLFCFNKIYAQNIEGKIINASTSEPVANANILDNNAEVVAVTGEEGVFEMNVAEFPARLQVSVLGFEDRFFQIRNQDERPVIYLTPSSEALSEVIIRSTIIPNELKEVPAAVNLLSSQDFGRNDATNLVQNFNYVPGMFVNQGALNTNKINIRGIGARSQYSTNRIQSYFDGIPLTTAEGELSLDDIDQEALERIEVIKGPTSSVYGAGLGGAINLYSARPGPEETRTAVKSQIGSFNTLKNSVIASHGTRNAQLFANYTNLTSDGYRDNGEYDRHSMLLNAKIATAEENTLSFLANFTRLKAFIPSSLNEEDFRNNPKAADANWEDSRGYESYDRGLMGVSYEQHFSENFSNTSSVYMNFRDAYEPRPFDILKEEQLAAGARTRFYWSPDLFGIPSEMSFGAEYYNEWYETGTFENLYEDFEDQGSLLGERLSNNEQDRNYSNFFWQLKLELSPRLGLEAGFNFNSTRYSLTDLFVQDEVDQSGDYSFDAVFSPRVGATYGISENKNLYASISHGFSTPTVAETLTPEGRINTDLKPETGVNYEFGFKGNWMQNRLYTELSLYSIQIEDLLVAQRVDRDQYVGVNAGKTDHNGVEFSANYHFNLSPQISVRPYVNAAFNFFEFDEFLNEEENFSGNDLPGVPRSTLNAGVDLINKNGLEFYGHFQSVGEIPLNDANSGYSDAYQLLNLKAAYNFNLVSNLDLQFYAGMNNVLDEHYAASILTNAVGFGGAAPRYYYPGNPRNYFAGVELNYFF